MKKKWKLLVPDWCSLDELWQNTDPFCLWPVGNQPLIAHWMDRAVDEAIDDIEIFVSDRPTAVRHYLNSGAYWSRKVKVTPISTDDKAPAYAIPLIGLPHDNTIDEPIASSADLLRHWLSLNQRWLEQIDLYKLRVETPLTERGWVGSQVRIHPSAKLVAPYWIQGKSDIGAFAEIGPFACIGANTIIDENASVRNSIVLPGTMVGRNTSLHQVAVEGGLLLDAKHGCRVPITDAFILSNLGQRICKTSISERLLAISLFVLASPIVALSHIDWTIIDAHDGSGGVLELKTGENGCLLARRWHWLREVFKGRMRLIGILPRPLEWKINDDRELDQRLKEASPGVLSLSDLHNCHNAYEPNEWIHASYQALSGDKNIRKLIRGNFWKLAFMKA
jgi:hypothetical protein